MRQPKVKNRQLLIKPAFCIYKEYHEAAASYPILKEQYFLPEQQKKNYKGPEVAGGRILLVDDSLDNQMTGLLLLQQAGYDCVVANNGMEALEKIQGTEIDLVLMDCQMPVLDGIEATKSYRATEPPDRHLPIIALTAASTGEDRELCIAAGMDGYLQKPFKAVHLFETIAYFLQSTRVKGSAEPILSHVTTVSNVAFGLSTPPPDWHQAEHFEPEPLVDLVAKTADVDPNLVHDLVYSFVTDFPTVLNDITSALSEQDFESIATLAHKMQSRCGNIGARKLQFLFRDIEVEVKSGATANLENYLEKMNQLFQSVSPLLREFRVNQLEEFGAL